MNEVVKSIPRELQQDRYWKGTLHIFLNNPKLKQHTAAYVDFEECMINAEGLKKLARPWSDSEKFMLNLALHLFNERHKVNLSDMDILDSNNREIALKAIQMRFAR